MNKSCSKIPNEESKLLEKEETKLSEKVKKNENVVYLKKEGSKMFFYLFIVTLLLFVDYASKVSTVDEALQKRKDTYAYKLSVGVRGVFDWVGGIFSPNEDGVEAANTLLQQEWEPDGHFDPKCDGKKCESGKKCPDGTDCDSDCQEGDCNKLD